MIGRLVDEEAECVRRESARVNRVRRLLRGLRRDDAFAYIAFGEKRRVGLPRGSGKKARIELGFHDVSEVCNGQRI